MCDLNSLYSFDEDSLTTHVDEKFVERQLAHSKLLTRCSRRENGTEKKIETSCQFSRIAIYNIHELFSFLVSMVVFLDWSTDKRPDSKLHA